ncbi:MAG: hypothetical protein ABSC18_01850 [Verrucomicrobiota bacterium]|jgi:hypothetical protein
MENEDPNTPNFSRRRFLQLLSAVTAWAMSRGASGAKAVSAPAPPQAGVKLRQPCVAIQVGAVSFVDEGIETVLDILREKAHVNTVWLNTYTWDHGTGGRQLAGYPFPDHGRQEVDNDFFGGAVFDYDPKYFRHTVLNQFRSPDYQGRNILREVLPKARERNLDVVAWDYFYPNQFNPQRLKNMDRVAEIDVRGKPTWAPCNNNEDWRQHMFGRIEVYLRQYPEVAGIAWGQERMGPLMNMIGGGWSQPFISCFCPLCRKKARARELSVERAQRGYLELEKLLAAARREERPSDGYFVSFWRLLSQFPEILGWEKLWTDSYHEIRAGVYRLAKSIAPEKPLGFHILHQATLSPFYRAEEDYALTANYADFVKPAMYNVAGGGRMAAYLDGLSGTLFHDAKPEDFLAFYYKVMNYDEAPYARLGKAGLSAGYVARETKRVLAAVQGRIAVYPGLDLGVPTHDKQITPEDVRDSVKAAFAAGAPGVVLSRKYSEMTLASLAAAGQGLREAGVA